MLEIENTLRPVAFSKVMINFASGHGVDIETCLCGTDISEHKLNDGGALIRREQEMRLIENLILALPNVAALGFKIGLCYNIATFGIWGFSLRTCRTLRDALQTALRFLPLSTAYCEISSFEQGDYFGLHLNPQSTPTHLRQFLLERDMATSIAVIKELSLNEIKNLKTNFTGPATADTSYIESICGIKPSFRSAYNSIRIPLSYVDRPQPTYDAKLARALADQCARQLRQRQPGGISDRVRQQVLGPLGLMASLDDVSAALTISSRTLRRKLDRENTSFRVLVEEERKQMAFQLLIDSDMKIEELAAHLGYTDTSSFTRAFKRWSDCSPRDYRDNSNADQPPSDVMVD
jgi:AraC-like DNA-binding protein